MKSIQFNSIMKVLLFAVALLTFGLFSGEMAAQVVNPGSSRQDSSAKLNPYKIGKPTQKLDTSKMMKGAKSKLTQSQINKIVGNDIKAGTDSQGRQLYKEVSTGKQYYINDSGTKVYIK